MTRDKDSSFAVIFRFGMIPLFLFSGTFFPVSQLPAWIRPVAYATPLWHGVALCRALSLGTADLGRALVHVGYLAWSSPPGSWPGSGPTGGGCMSRPAMAGARYLRGTSPCPPVAARCPLGPPAPAGRAAAAGAALHLIERHARAYRHCLADARLRDLRAAVLPAVHRRGPRCAGRPGGRRPVSFTSFVAPALLASSSMNGAVFDSTFNVFFRLKYAKIYDSALATPMRSGDIALGEIGWALLRGGLYAAARSWSSCAHGPGPLSVGAGRAARGAADRLRLRGGRDGRHDVHAQLAGL